MLNAQKKGAAVDRTVAHIIDPPKTSGRTPGHVLRALIGSGEAIFADPFLLMAEDWVPHGAFPLHPHRGIETVTFVIEGAIEHYDSGGSRGVIEAGDAQWMTAGRGVLHEENAVRGTVAHALQLWVNLPARLKMVEPRYQNLGHDSVAKIKLPGSELRIFSGSQPPFAAETLNHVPILMVEVRLEPGAEQVVTLPAGDNAFLFVISGELLVTPGVTAVHGGQLAWLSRHPAASQSQVRLAADKMSTRILLFSGPPLGEPIVFGGPFVMNTDEQIEQAYRDYGAGKFQESAGSAEPASRAGPGAQESSG